MRKQCALLAANAAAQFHDDIALIVGVFGQQQNLDLLLQLLQQFLCRSKLLLRHFPEFRVMKQFFRRRFIGRSLTPRFICLYHRAQFLQFPVNVAQLFSVSIHIGAGKLKLQILVPQSQCFQFFLHRVLLSFDLKRDSPYLRFKNSRTFRRNSSCQKV